jgi:hypothetical protein
MTMTLRSSHEDLFHYRCDCLVQNPLSYGIAVDGSRISRLVRRPTEATYSGNLENVLKNAIV